MGNICDNTKNNNDYTIFFEIQIKQIIDLKGEIQYAFSLENNDLYIHFRFLNVDHPIVHLIIKSTHAIIMVGQWHDNFNTHIGYWSLDRFIDFMIFSNFNPKMIFDTEDIINFGNKKNIILCISTMDGINKEIELL